MSVEVKQRLVELKIETTHEERRDLDKEIERITGKNCEEGVKLLGDSAFRALVDRIKRRKEKRIVKAIG